MEPLLSCKKKWHTVPVDKVGMGLRWTNTPLVLLLHAASGSQAGAVLVIYCCLDKGGGGL